MASRQGSFSLINEDKRKNSCQIPSGNLTYLWKTTTFNGTIHYKWPFSIAMLNYQRVPIHHYFTPCAVGFFTYLWNKRETLWKWHMIFSLRSPNKFDHLAPTLCLLSSPSADSFHRGSSVPRGMKLAPPGALVETFPEGCGFPSWEPTEKGHVGITMP